MQQQQQQQQPARRISYSFPTGIFQGRTVAVKIPLRKEDFEEALVEFKKLRNFRHRNVVEAIAYCKDPAMFGTIASPHR